jgi:integrase
LPRLTETRALRATLPRSGQAFIWCSEVRGFGCRLLATGVRSWVVQVRYQGKAKRITLGPVGTLAFEGPPDSPGALDLARAALNAGRRSEDPKRAIGRTRNPRGITLGELWAAYATAGYPLLNDIVYTRAASVATDGLRWSKHFVRAGIADEAAADFDNARTQRWLDTIAGLGARSHALILLKSLIGFGASRGLCDPHRITLAGRPSRKVQNFLKPDELKRLDAALVALAAEQPTRRIGFAALRLLLHTGMRKGEVLTLDWSHVDLERRVLHLERDKSSGQNVGRDVLLSATAVAILASLPRLARGGWLFPGGRRGAHLVNLEFFWAQALARAEVRRVRIHDLRHSYASAAISDGVSLYTVGKILGHRSSGTTERYAHLSAEAQREAIERAAAVLAR